MTDLRDEIVNGVEAQPNGHVMEEELNCPNDDSGCSGNLGECCRQKHENAAIFFLPFISQEIWCLSGSDKLNVCCSSDSSWSSPPRSTPRPPLQNYFPVSNGTPQSLAALEQSPTFVTATPAVPIRGRPRSVGHLRSAVSEEDEDFLDKENKSHTVPGQTKRRTLFDNKKSYQ